MVEEWKNRMRMREGREGWLEDEGKNEGGEGRGVREGKDQVKGEEAGRKGRREVRKITEILPASKSGNL